MLTHELVPPRRAGSEPRYAMVLHGLGDSMAGWIPVVDELRLPQLGYVFVDAPEAYYGGFSWFPIPGMTAPEHGPAQLLAGVGRSHRLLEDLLQQLEAQHGLARERIIPFGFSQGCTMALDLALKSDRAFAGVVGISGFYPLLDERVPGFGAAALEQDILLTHGRFDSVLPIERTRDTVRAMQRLGLHIDWREYDKDHGLDPQRELGDLREWLARHA